MVAIKYNIGNGKERQETSNAYIYGITSVLCRWNGVFANITLLMCSSCSPIRRTSQRYVSVDELRLFIRSVIC